MVGRLSVYLCVGCLCGFYVPRCARKTVATSRSGVAGGSSRDALPGPSKGGIYPTSQEVTSVVRRSGTLRSCLVQAAVVVTSGVGTQ